MWHHFSVPFTVDKNESEACSLLQGEYEDKGQPSPRAKMFVDSGEWETRDAVLFHFSSGDVERICGARISSAGSVVTFCVAPLARDLSDMMIDGTCATQRHMAEICEARVVHLTAGTAGTIPKHDSQLESHNFSWAGQSRNQLRKVC